MTERPLSGCRGIASGLLLTVALGLALVACWAVVPGLVPWE